MTGPTLQEAAAIMAAADTFTMKMHPRKPRPVSELPRMLDELAVSLERMRSVTQGCAHPRAVHIPTKEEA